MGWQFWRREPGPKAIDSNLRNLIMSRFGLTAIDVDKLSVIKRSGTFAGRPVTRIRVYNPSLVDESLGSVNAYKHLDVQDNALCFEGHSEKGRETDLTARACVEETSIAA